MDRLFKSKSTVGGHLKTACLLSILLVIVIALTGCDTTSAKEKAKSKSKKAKQVEATSTDNSESSDSSSATSSNTSKEKDKEASKDKKKDNDKSKSKEKSNNNNSSSSSSSSSSASIAKQKVWVPAQGHYEQVKVLKCRCGQEFNSAAEHATHRNDYIAEHRKTNPNFECKGEHLPKGWVTKSVWKVDVPGHYEYR